MKLIRLLIAALLAAATLAGLTAARADTTAETLTATGSGWCSTTQGCNNTNVNAINNTYAGLDDGVYRNWFAFVLPSSQILSATLSIYNDAQSRSGSAPASYSVTEAAEISYAGLYGSIVLATVSLASANTGVGHFVDLVFTQAGLDWLNQHLGQNIVVGGTVTTGTTACTANCGGAFGWTDGTPVATLALQTVAVSVPGPIAAAGLPGLLAIAGFGLLRRRRAIA